MFDLRRLIAVPIALFSIAAHAFCGFYVARADQSLYNDASQVVLVRDGDRTVVTMNNNFRGDVDEFAIVIPVPTLLEQGQINVAERSLIEHLDAYTAPRLVEYFDKNPCAVLRRFDMMDRAPPATLWKPNLRQVRAKSLGVTIEAEYAVGEYDIVILSATQSQGLTTWLKESGYQVPDAAVSTIGSYLKQGMKFFVAKVNLKTQQQLGYTYLRPIQIAYESARFMLPIRLGMVNAERAQELYVYALSKTGRVETRNYRTVKIPTGMELPVSVKDNFGPFYKAMFTRQVSNNNSNVALLEYAWDMAWCDPCAADPLTPAQLRQLGVYWLGGEAPLPGGVKPGRPRIMPQPQAVDVFVTRLHLRYDQAHFPEDLMFIETGERENFQGRYVIRHPWRGEASCPAAQQYFETSLPKRLSVAARTLANLTGWSLAVTPGQPAPAPAPEKPWWEKLWEKPDRS